MYQVSQGLIEKIIRFFLLIAIVINLLGAAYDVNSIFSNSDVDLRNRVVGARLLIRGIDPYYYRWKPGDPEIFIDPSDNLELPVSRVTIPPIGLALYAPFANFPYIYQKLIWLFLQWFAFIASLFILSRSNLSKTNQLLIGFGLFFIGASISWRLHVGRGQIYIFYVLLTALSYWALQQKNRFSDELAGFFMGLAASMRFPIVIFMLPMLIFKKFRLLMATLAGCSISILSSILVFGSQTWFSYFSAAQTISKLSNGAIKIAPNPENSVFPSVIEGLFSGSGSITSSVDRLPIANSSLPLLIDQFFDVRISISYIIAGLMILLLAYSFCIYYLKRRSTLRHQIPTPDVIFIFGGLMVLIADFLIPVPRYSYSDIQFLIPLILILKNANFQKTITCYLASLLCLGLLILGGLFSWVPLEVLVGEFLLLSTLILMSLVQFADSPSDE